MFAPTVRKRSQDEKTKGSQRGQMRENERAMEATQKIKIKRKEKKERGGNITIL